MELFTDDYFMKRALAEAQGVPAYVVFADRTLIEMAERRPTTKTELSTVHGVGAAKLERFGEVFLRAIRDFEA